MATCKDCLYFKRCVVLGVELDMKHDKEADKNCRHFKSKADFVEVKHGQWLDNIEKTSTVAGITKDFAIGYKCSLCGRTELKKEPYCNCGAKMRGVKDA